MKTCFKCGKPPLFTSDGEVTCSDKKCFVATRTFTPLEWEGSVPNIYDMCSLLENQFEVNRTIQALITKIFTGDMTPDLEGQPLLPSLVYLSGMISTCSGIIAVTLARIRNG